MREQDITARVGDLAEQVRKRVKIEDDRIELKLLWPDPHEAARHIAAHANASRGDWVLWVIGMKDSTGKIATPNPQPDPSTWWAQVRSKFENGHAPAAQFVGVPIGQERVMAIAFETDLTPFVVENEKYGAGDKVKWEVPWREGTAIRTAGRVDLLRILAPRSVLPAFEISDSDSMLRLDPSIQLVSGGDARILLDVTFYVIPATRDPITIPRHKCGVMSCLP
jgi:hypothetical protein